MDLFKITGKASKLEKIESRDFRWERDLQEMTEKNLWDILGLDFVCTEFTIEDRRIDSLAFDEEINAFVIIEYKKRKSYKLLRQGLTYISLMLENKAVFVRKYNEEKKANIRTSQVEWEQSRVILVSPVFTPSQREEINLEGLPVELWEVKKYENNCINYNLLEKSDAKASIKALAGKGLKPGKSGKGAKIAVSNESIKRIIREIKVYTEKDHFAKGGRGMVSLYKKLKDGILNIDGGVRVKPRQNYIAFATNVNVTRIKIQKSQLKMYINMPKGKLKDPEKIMKDASYRNRNGEDYQTNIKSDENLEDILKLVEQSLKYKRTRKRKKQ